MRDKLFPDVVMYCELCEGAMFEAPIGSNTLACISCGVVKYER
jgi:hypothetical protein